MASIFKNDSQARTLTSLPSEINLNLGEKITSDFSNSRKMLSFISANTNKNIIDNTDTATNSYNVLQYFNCSVVDKNKDFSLMEEQSNINKSNNSKISTSNKKSRKKADLSANKSFSSEDDPFYTTDTSVTQDERIKLAQDMRKKTYQKSSPVAIYLVNESVKKPRRVQEAPVSENNTDADNIVTDNTMRISTMTTTSGTY